MLYIISILLVIVIGLIDGCLSSVIAGFLIFAVSNLQAFLVNKSCRHDAFKICQIVFPIYYFMAFVISRAFENGNHFLVSDAGRYIAYNRHFTAFLDEKQNLLRCYFYLADNDALYHTYLRAVAIFGNTVLGGTSPFYMTLAQTLFGILSINVLYRILSSSLRPQKALNATISYAFFSIFFLYSCLVIRDIIISYLFLLAFEVILKPYKTIGLLKLILIMLVTWGIRLYSGLFILMFILYYVYRRLSKTGAKYILIPLSIVIIGYIMNSLTVVVDQSMDAIADADEHTLERGGGLIMKLLTLPPILKQIAMFFWTQIAPFPPTGALFEAYSFPTFVMSVLIIIYEIWWYLIAYTMIYFLLYKGYFVKIHFDDKLLLLIAVSLIVATSSHPDIRRMMPVYPIIYYEYQKLEATIAFRDLFKKIRRNLVFIYIGLILIYNILKF